MAIKQREYLFTVNRFREPQVVTGKTAIAVSLIRLILLQPGSDPLHPEMGVGLKNYRYSLSQLEELQERIQEQIETYLPDYQASQVAIIQNTKDKICNIEITIDDIVYVYDSTTAPIPITLADLSE